MTPIGQRLPPSASGWRTGWGDRVELLSGGQRQSLALIMATLSPPDVLLLDEHTAALDPRVADLVVRATLEAIRDRPMATLMVTHNMDHAIAHGDRLLMMHAGRIILDIGGQEKRDMTTARLVDRFHRRRQRPHGPALRSAHGVRQRLSQPHSGQPGAGCGLRLCRLGVMVPFRLLSLPDLTAEGSFPLGAAVAATLLAGGADIPTADAASLLAGALAGGATALVHLFFNVTSLLAGIIVLTMLFSINIRIMGKPNTSIFDVDTLFTALLGPDGGFPLDQFGLLMLVLALLCLALYLFLHTEIGLGLRAVGSNQVMARAQGLSTPVYVIGGLALAGSLSSLGGAVMAQYQSYADVSMGVGVLVIGLASTILGEAIVGRQTLVRQILAPAAGALIYFQIVAMALSLGLKPSDLKLMTGLFVLLALAVPILRARLRA